jgi:3-hydroxybutyryl-CoA dehydrogenase
MIDAIKNVGVVGLGVMGFDIAFLYAMKGYRTLAYDASKPAMEALSNRRENVIERLRRRNRISDTEVENVRKGLIPAPDIESMATVDLVTEAVSEVADTKVAVYEALKGAGFSGVLTTNTSSLTRARLLSNEPYQRENFASTHFFNPVLYTQMVEVVKGDMEKASFEATIVFLASLGRKPVETRDISGFVSNSLLMYYAVMALWLLQRGAGIEAVDQTAKQMRLLPPLTSFDSWKPSIVEDVTKVMFQLRGDRFLRSSTLLSTLARGNPAFYIDQKANPEIYRKIGVSRSPIEDATIQRALKASIYIGAARVVELGEDPAKVEVIAVEGIKIPNGPLKEIDEIGARAVLEDLKSINREVVDNELTAPALLTAMAEQNQTFFYKERPNPWVSLFLERQRSHASH